MTRESEKFREQIRLLVRKMGLLNKGNNGSFCCSKVTLSQCHALVEIGRAENLSLKELADILMLDVSTTSRTVDALVKKNYAKRENSTTDRRSIQIKLTELGQQLFQDIEAKMDNDYFNYFEHIPLNERENVLHSMDLILEALEKSLFQ